MITNYEERAIAYAEEYGIIDYKVNGKKMIYYKNYYVDCFREEKKTAKFVVDLETMEAKGTTLKRLNRKGDLNMYI